MAPTFGSETRSFLTPVGRAELVDTALEVIRVALPNVAGFVLNLLNELTNVMFIGHTQNASMLAAVGLGNMVQNCVALSVSFGLCAAMDSLVSQAFGANQHHLSCQHLQRARLLLTLQLVWMVPILWYSEELLRSIGQDPEVSKHAGHYCRATVPGLFALFQFEASRKFLMNRCCVLAPAVISGFTSLCHVGWCTYFIAYKQLGNAGAGCANTATWWLSFVLISLYIWFGSFDMGFRRRDVLLVQRDSLKGLRPYIRLAFPTTVQMCSEWWFWEICALMVGYFGSTQLAAHVTTVNFVSMSFMPSIGLSVSSATLVGNALGSRQSDQAKLYAFCCTMLCVAAWTPIGVFVFFRGKWLASLYGANPEVVDLAARLLQIYAGIGFFDSAQTVMGGALRGLAKQDLAATVYLVCFYAVTLPMAYVFGFQMKKEVIGVWASLATGSALATVLFAVTLCRSKWEALFPDESESRSRPSLGSPLSFSLQSQDA